MDQFFPRSLTDDQCVRILNYTFSPIDDDDDWQMAERRSANISFVGETLDSIEIPCYWSNHDYLNDGDDDHDGTVQQPATDSFGE